MLYPLLFVAESAPQHGTGHLMRVGYYLSTLFPQAHLGVENVARSRSLLRRAMGLAVIEEHRVVALSEIAHRYRVVVIDRRRLTRSAWQRYCQLGEYIVGLDVVGSAQPYVDYIIDMLPRIRGSAPNYHSYRLLPLPHLSSPLPRRNEGSPSLLVRIGGAPGDQLARQVVSQLLRRGSWEPSSITVLLSCPAILEFPIKTLLPSPQLREKLHRYDLVITSFGIMALEAVAAGCAVLLINLSPYHARLAHTMGFYCLGRSAGALRRLPQALTKLHKISQSSQKVREQLFPQSQAIELPALLQMVAQSSAKLCPLCKDRESRAVARFVDRTYRRCQHCQLLFMHSHSSRSPNYNRNYFEEDYRVQYGKSYLEDYAAIYRIGVERMRIIQQLVPAATEKTLLDVGCAFGPFLEAARDHGFQPWGIDLSSEAVEYVQRVLHLPAVCSNFLSFVPPADSAEHFAVISMWYVIEHFSDLGAALTKAGSLLRPGGLLAIATPNGQSWAMRRSCQRALAESPVDHYTILEPRRIAAQLERYGFRVAKIVIHGHHPERYPIYLRPVVPLLSPLLALGSTFSFYAYRNAA